MFEVLITPAARKEAKKLPKRVRVTTYEATERLKNSPYLGEKLAGSLSFLYSLHFKVEGRDYRMAYTVDAEKKIIIVHLIQIREGFYQRLKRLFR